MDTPAPTWLGIGAMRSGTTFFADCLRQHSMVDLGLNGRKEQRRLHKIGRDEERDARYLAQFGDSQVLRGDFSVRYMWLPEAATNAERLLPSSAPIFVVLRDPLARYESHMKLASARRRRYRRGIWQSDVAQGLAQLIGNYADHLRRWISHVDQARFEVFSFEDATENADETCARAWGRLGLGPEPFNVQKARTNASDPAVEWSWPPGVKDALGEVYARQLTILESDWGQPFTRWIDGWSS